MASKCRSIFAILNVDNISVRKNQIDRLNQIRATRDNNICQKKLEDLENICRNKSGNILEFAVDAARNRATVGEISSALEKWPPPEPFPYDVQSSVAE